MRTLSKAFIAGSVVATAIVAAAIVRRRRMRPDRPHAESAGSMFVGAVDEVELGGPFGAGMNPESFDPDEIPSEHQEINELRGKMPMG